MKIVPHGQLIAIIPSAVDPALNRMPGKSRWVNDARKLVVWPDAINLDYILGNWPNAVWTGGAAEVRDKYVDTNSTGEKLVALKKSEETVEITDYKFFRPPLQHQAKAFIVSRDAINYALFMEQGTGKTKVTLDNSAYLFEKKLIEMLIVVAWPCGVHRSWVENEIPKDLGHIKHAAEFWAGNYKTKKKQKAFEEMLWTGPDTLKIMTYNVEAFSGEKSAARKHILELLKNFKCMLVVDQSASIKTPQSKRAKFLIREAGPLAAFRRILDGQPVAEGAHELFAQFNFLDKNIIGCTSWTSFRARYCNIGYFNEIKSYKNVDELHGKIDKYCFRVRASECLDLPPLQYRVHRFSLSAAERKIYDEIKKKAESEFAPEGETLERLEVAWAVTKTLRLQQICSGWWPGKDSLKLIDKSSRLSALKILLEELDGPALIFARFTADIKMIKDMLGKEAVEYYGGVSQEDRAKAKRDFQAGKIKYFIGQPKTAGIGHTLTAAKHIVFYSLDHSLRFREECEKRAHRHGAEHKLMIVWDLIAENTIDAQIVRALKEKKDISRDILGDPKAREEFFK